MTLRIFQRTVLAAVMVGGVAATAVPQIPLPPGLHVRITTGRPPAPRREVRVVRPGPDYVWIAGFYDADDRGRYRWVPGRWERPVVSDGYWIPARYIRTSRGTIYEPGHWSNQQVVVDDEVSRRREWRRHQGQHERELARERNRDYYRDHDDRDHH